VLVSGVVSSGVVSSGVLLAESPLPPHAASTPPRAGMARNDTSSDRRLNEVATNGSGWGEFTFMHL
jgi:hypothetical protein